jgi:beta-lactamase superfamily II metal-dependent hydrolase
MPDRLAITFIDVGFGSSIFLECEEANGNRVYALVDCNDSSNEWNALLFVKRFFQRNNIDFGRPHRAFSFVLVTHTHADHIAGIGRMVRTFGCDFLLYSESSSTSDLQLAKLLQYRKRPRARLGAIQPVRAGLPLAHIPFGPAVMTVLWPPQNFRGVENDHSVVLSVRLGQVAFVLTGDVSAARFTQFITAVGADTKVFQVPHHGAHDGTFDNGNTPWVTHFANIGTFPFLAISCHRVPHQHPDPTVISKLTASLSPAPIRRTDKHFHLKFETDGTNVVSYYTHA